MIKPLHIVISLLIGVAAGIFLSPLIDIDRRDIPIQRDTTITVDTNIFINPIPIDITVNIGNDIIEVPASDIEVNEDSLIVLPKSVKTYSDKSYRCQVSGYQPNLDWIEVYPERVTVKEYIPTRDRRRHSVEVSPMVIVGSKVQLPLMAGYRYSGDIFQFHASAGYEIFTDSPMVVAGVTIPIKRW